MTTKEKVYYDQNNVVVYNMGEDIDYSIEVVKKGIHIYTTNESGERVPGLFADDVVDNVLTIGMGSFECKKHDDNHYIITIPNTETQLEVYLDYDREKTICKISFFINDIEILPESSFIEYLMTGDTYVPSKIKHPIHGNINMMSENNLKLHERVKTLQACYDRVKNIEHVVGPSIYSKFDNIMLFGECHVMDTVPNYDVNNTVFFSIYLWNMAHDDKDLLVLLEIDPNVLKTSIKLDKEKTPIPTSKYLLSETFADVRSCDMRYDIPEMKLSTWYRVYKYIFMYVAKNTKSMNETKITKVKIELGDYEESQKIVSEYLHKHYKNFMKTTQYTEICEYYKEKNVSKFQPFTFDCNDMSDLSIYKYIANLTPIMDLYAPIMDIYIIETIMSNINKKIVVVAGCDHIKLYRSILSNIKEETYYNTGNRIIKL